MGFYVGYSATVLRNLPAHIMVFRVTKQNHLESFQSVLCGALVDTISASVTMPLDDVKMRLMTRMLFDFGVLHVRDCEACDSECTPKAKFERISTNKGNLFSIWNYDGKIASEDIIEATEDFHIKYCIGTGAYGSVYKAHLPVGNIVALKKLDQMEAQNPSFDKSFHNEIKIFRKVALETLMEQHPRELISPLSKLVTYSIIGFIISTLKYGTFIVRRVLFLKSKKLRYFEGRRTRGMATAQRHLLSASSVNHEEERQTLLQSGWWNDNGNISNHCGWKGITCNEAASVTYIFGWDLTIPPSKELRRIERLNLSAFPHLEFLYLNGMGLAGTIPQDISSLKNLTVLDLSSNRLHGSIPIQLANLMRLSYLSLFNNSLTGSIPSILGQLKNLHYLFLDSNKLEGNVPIELGNLTNLMKLYLSRNLLTSSLPSTLGQLENLTTFHV
ncbi:hypothetical protein Fmac_011940 [Flemingia macrophylla]|uniref:Uncharacterized protein n=1 Tax=Flemingia macrophylla TaxID=520843 RepID=A0ABD1MNW4_9FABA